MDHISSLMPVAFLPNFSGWEVFAIILVILLLFGGKKLPELARGAGKALREFRKISSETEETFKRAMEEEDESAKPAAKATQPTQPAQVQTQKPADSGDNNAAAPRSSAEDGKHQG